MTFSLPGNNDQVLDILKQWPAKFSAILASAEEHRLQVLFTQTRSERGRLELLERLGFRSDREYFYPASSIKICGALAALQEAQSLSDDLGVALDLQTPLCFHPLNPEQQPFDKDPTNRDGGTVTLEHEIRKLFLVSDNDAYNRLYTLVGQAALNHRMWKLGFPTCRLTHRLGLPDPDDDDPRLGGRVEVRDPGASFCLPGTRSHVDLGTRKDVPGIEVGKGYVKKGHLVASPMDFSHKNYMSLRDLQDLLIRLVFPDCCPSSEPSISPPADQRKVLLEAMLQYPSQSRNPVYDSAHYPDDYCKFFLPGLCRVSPKADWHIYNKIGRAYGFTVDNAYIEHLPSGGSFFLSAVLYTNANGILDDDIYEYDLADVFLADLAEVLARAALGIPLDRPPLTEPELDFIPSSQWPKPSSDSIAVDGLVESSREVGILTENAGASLNTDTSLASQECLEVGPSAGNPVAGPYVWLGLSEREFREVWTAGGPDLRAGSPGIGN